MISLSIRGRKIKSAFDRLLNNVRGHDKATFDPTQLELESQNFLLWAVNLGLFDAGHSSLDYRLQDAPEASEFAADLLANLLEHLEALGSLSNGASEQQHAQRDQGDNEQGHGLEGESDSDEDEIDELSMHMLTIADILHRLFRLARSIRNYATRSSQGRRNIYSTIPSEDRTAVFERLIEIERLRVSDFILQMRKSDTIEQTPEDSTSILTPEDSIFVDRLAKANSRRRQQFVYWRHRNDRSHAAVDEEELEFEAAAPVPQVQAFVPAERVARAASIPSSVTKVQSAQINLGDQKSVASEVSRAPSAKGPSGERAGWPPIPEGVETRGKYFSCPFCFNLCPERYRSDRGWKAHLTHDLRPYCCTYQNCQIGDQLYDDWASWTTHEELVHNKVWTCLEHVDQEFRTVEDYQLHVERHHRDQTESMLTSEIKTARATGSLDSGRVCPFCLAEILETRAMQHHIAWHLETVSLMALPRSTGYEQGSEQGDLRSNVQGEDDEDSRIGELDDVSLPGESDLENAEPSQKRELSKEELERLTAQITANVIEQLKQEKVRREQSEAVSSDKDDEATGDVESDVEQGDTDSYSMTAFYSPDGQRTPHMEKALRDLAHVIIQTYDPKNSIVITPDKMIQFYGEHSTRVEKYNWTQVFDDRTSSISRMLRSLEIEHHLVQEKLNERPDTPGLTPNGFIAWMDINIRTDPDAEFERVQSIGRLSFRGGRYFLRGSPLRRAIREQFPKAKDDNLDKLLKTALKQHCNVDPFDRAAVKSSYKSSYESDQPDRMRPDLDDEPPRSRPPERKIR